MKAASAALIAHLAGETTTLALCIKFTLQNGTVHAFTDHDRELVIGGVTYESVAGFSASDIATSSDTDVDNLEISGGITSPSITEDDLRAGLWDYAAFTIFMVNWADLTMGMLSMRDGRLGQVTLERGLFKVDLDGLLAAYRRVIGRIDSATCDANLGDARCLQDMTAFTKTGTVTGVNADGLTLYDTSRTEAGPGGGYAITGITNANPGVVTLATTPSPALTEGQLVTISGVLGMTPVNVVTTVHSPSGTTFHLSVDTSDTGAFPPYTSGGAVTPFGNSGYFDSGVITFASGLNNGFSMEIKSYVEGQFTLYLPLPYAVQVGDAYSAKAGCDKSLETCRDRFANLVHFRGSPYVPGLDKIVQVGRRNG